MDLSISLSIYLSFYLSIYLSSHLYIYLSIYLLCPASSANPHVLLTFDNIHNGVHFFHISTAKSGPDLVCFVHFDLEMCFAPQRRALFPHLNCQKCSETQVFCTFWLGNVLRATTACNFSSLIWPAGSAPAALASLLFDPPEPQIIGKTQCFATFLPFHASASSSYSFSSTLLFSNLSLLSASSLLCFSYHSFILVPTFYPMDIHMAW